MLCKECGKESQEGMKFCGFCGSCLEDKIKCDGCKEWVEDALNFCPHCSRKLKNADRVEVTENNNKIVTDRNTLFASLTNYIVIILCLGLFLVLFGKISGLKDNYFQITETSENVVDYVDASIKGISDFSTSDFEQLFFKNSSNFNKLNYLNLYMINEFDEIFIIQKDLVYVSLVLIITMMVLPLILLGYTIYDLTQLNKSNRYKKFFLVTLLLGLILVITTTLMGHLVSIGTISYLLLSCFGLLYSYIIDIVSKERRFSGKIFVSKLISSLTLFVLIFIATSNVATFHYQSKRENINFGKFALIYNHLRDSEVQIESSYFVRMFTTVGMKAVNEWVIYLALLIPILMTVTVGFLILVLISEISKHINLKKRNDYTTLFIWLAFILELSVISIITIVVKEFNAFITSYGDNLNLQIGSGIIILTILTLALAIYKSIIPKVLNEVM